MLLLSLLSYHPQPCSGPWLLPMLYCLPIRCIRCPFPACLFSPCLPGPPVSLHFLSGRGWTGPRSEEGGKGNLLQSCYTWKCFWEWNKDTTTFDEDVRIYQMQQTGVQLMKSFGRAIWQKISRTLKTCSSLDPAIPFLKMVRMIIDMYKGCAF